MGMVPAADEAQPKSADTRYRGRPPRKAGSGRGYGGMPAGSTASESGYYDYDVDDPTAPPAEPEPAVDFESLRRSTQAQARATQVSGLTRFDLDQPVTVPDGTSTMVAIVNQAVEAEETFLFKPGGAGIGYESNPYRVVRFRNSTPFVLEPGPISIYAGGSFVGEGLSEAVSANTSATVPFAVEPGIMVSSKTDRQDDEMRLLRIVHRTLFVENFRRRTTTWTAKAQTMQDGYTVLIRHPKAGWKYELHQRPPGTEELRDGYLVPLVVPAGRRTGSVSVTEQTPSEMSISIWDGPAIKLLEDLLVATGLDAAARAKLEPIVRVRKEMGRIDTQIDGLRRQQQALDQRADETRQNLRAIRKDARAGALRAKLTQRLEEFTEEANRIGREIVTLQSARLEKKIELEDLLEGLELHAPEPQKPHAPKEP